MHKWWAEYVESVGDWDTAVQFYEAAKDYLSLVRILCFNGNVQKAIQVLRPTVPMDLIVTSFWGGFWNKINMMPDYYVQP